MLPLALAAAALPSVVKGFSGLVQSRKGNMLAKQNVRPAYEIPNEFKTNLAIAENMAQTGLPQQQYINAQNGIQGNQNAAFRQLNRMGRPASIASIVRGGNDAMINLNIADANARQQNQRYAMGQRGILGQQSLAKQNWDKFQKYQENADAAEALKGAGRQNSFGALNDLSQLAQVALSDEDQDQGQSQSSSGQYYPGTGFSGQNQPFNANTMWNWYKKGGMGYNKTY